MSFKQVCLIGFGEVGQILAADLAATGVTRIAAYDILFRDPDSLPSRAQGPKELRKYDDARHAAADADLVISAVTAAADVDAANSVVGGIAPGTFFLDLNSTSPDTKQQASAIIGKAGGRYVEAAIITPFAPKRIASAMLLGGPHASAFLESAELLGFSGKLFSEQIGRAAAVKMCRSVLIKGLESLLMESLLTAHRYGVEKTVLDSLSDLLPVGDWDALAFYMISRSLEHGARRAEEMREAARTVGAAGVEPLMSDSIVRRQEFAALQKAVLQKNTLGEMLENLLTDIDKRRIADGAA